MIHLSSANQFAPQPEIPSLKIRLIMNFLIHVYLNNFSKKLKNPSKIQMKVLKNILHQNRNTEFGKLHGFSNIKTYSDYKIKIAPADYENYRNLIDQQD